MSDAGSDNRREHWRRSSRLTFVILAIWFVFGFVAPWFARDLVGGSFLGFPLGYYLIVQGSLIVFVLLIVVHNLLQDRIDDECGLIDE